MKVERWEEENDEEWAERLAEEIVVADNTETTQHFFQQGMLETEIIINYIREDGWTWKEHPEGPFTCKQILEWKNKAAKWDEVEQLLPKTIEILREVNKVNELLGPQSSAPTTIKEKSE